MILRCLFDSCFVEEGFRDDIVMILDHFLFLRPLQKLISSYSDFKLLFDSKNVLVSSDEFSKNDATKKEVASKVEHEEKPSLSSCTETNDPDSDSDIDIDAIVEMSINEFNRQETFKQDVVEEYHKERIRRKSLEEEMVGEQKSIFSDDKRPSSDINMKDIKSAKKVETKPKRVLYTIESVDESNFADNSKDEAKMSTDNNEEKEEKESTSTEHCEDSIDSKPFIQSSESKSDVETNENEVEKDTNTLPGIPSSQSSGSGKSKNDSRRRNSRTFSATALLKSPSSK